MLRQIYRAPYLILQDMSVFPCLSYVDEPFKHTKKIFVVRMSSKQLKQWMTDDSTVMKSVERRLHEYLLRTNAATDATGREAPVQYVEESDVLDGTVLEMLHTEGQSLKSLLAYSPLQGSGQ